METKKQMFRNFSPQNIKAQHPAQQQDKKVMIQWTVVQDFHVVLSLKFNPELVFLKYKFCLETATFFLQDETKIFHCFFHSKVFFVNVSWPYLACFMSLGCGTISDILSLTTVSSCFPPLCGDDALQKSNVAYRCDEISISVLQLFKALFCFCGLTSTVLNCRLISSCV